jgi:hypothetical protein
MQQGRAAAVSHAKYDRLIAIALKEATIKVAVAHPCDDVSLRGAVEAKRLGLIEPILVGPDRACAGRRGASWPRPRRDGDRGVGAQS